MENPNQNISALSKPSNALLLKENKEAAREIDGLLFACANSQKLYGREPEAFHAGVKVIHSVLGRFPAEKAVKSLQTWLERSTEFPTPADLVNLIKRNGKPPLKESDIIAIRKKDGEDRSRDEWESLKEWDEQQRDGWKTEADPVKDQATLQENIRLRQELRELKDEYRRLAELNAQLKAQKSPEPPKPSQDEKVQRTIQVMRESGAAQADIDEFIAGYAA